MNDCEFGKHKYTPKLRIDKNPFIAKNTVTVLLIVVKMPCTHLCLAILLPGFTGISTTFSPNSTTELLSFSCKTKCVSFKCFKMAAKFVQRNSFMKIKFIWFHNNLSISFLDHSERNVFYQKHFFRSVSVINYYVLMYDNRRTKMIFS